MEAILTMFGTIVNIGILFHAFVSAMVASAAFALTIFLLRQPNRLTPAIRSYAWFWCMTVLVWVASAIRYLLISLGNTGPIVHELDLVMQTAVFLSGPPLLLYVSARIFQRRSLGWFLASISVAMAGAAIWFILQPNGLSPLVITFFSAETTINATSFALFAVEVGVIFTLLTYDIVTELRQWRNSRDTVQWYGALYSTAIVIYLLLGSIDQASLITDWLVIIFRMLYAATFLSVYILIVHHHAMTETYLMETTAADAPS